MINAEVPVQWSWVTNYCYAGSNPGGDVAQRKDGGSHTGQQSIKIMAMMIIWRSSRMLKKKIIMTATSTLNISRCASLRLAGSSPWCNLASGRACRVVRSSAYLLLRALSLKPRHQDNNDNWKKVAGWWCSRRLRETPTYFTQHCLTTRTLRFLLWASLPSQ